MRTRDHHQVSASSVGRRVATIIGLALLAGWASVPIGCGDDEACTPGAQVSCACGGGKEGAQACNEDGTALGTCDCSNVTGSGGSGNGGPGSGAAGAQGPGSGATGPGSGGAGPSAGGAGPASSSGGGPGAGGFGVCDGKNVCEDSDDDNTNDCVGCALDGACNGAAQACGNSPDCAIYFYCLQQCGQTPDCVADCDAQSPEGKVPFQVLAGCVCGECTNDCADSYFCP